MNLSRLWRPLEPRGLRGAAPLLAVGLLLMLLAPGWGPAGRSLLLLAGCGALAVVGLRWFSRGQEPGRPTPLRVVSRAPLSAKSGVALIEADGRRYLVAFGDGFATMLAGAPADGAAPSPVAGSQPLSVTTSEVGR